jgi:hypothetical protein
VVDAYYGDGATLGEVRVTHPDMAMVVGAGMLPAFGSAGYALLHWHSASHGTPSPSPSSRVGRTPTGNAGPHTTPSRGSIASGRRRPRCAQRVRLEPAACRRDAIPKGAPFGLCRKCPKAASRARASISAVGCAPGLACPVSSGPACNATLARAGLAPGSRLARTIRRYLSRFRHSTETEWP